jgi:diaminopimelate epimerase
MAMNGAAASHDGSVPFTKASACGNDFILIDGMHAPADIPAFTRRICDRHDGVGADGVEWLFPDSGNEADVRIRLFNADGSEAEISGNGTRCVAAFLVAERGKSEVAIRTGAGLKSCRLVSRDAQCFTFEMNMGEPEVGDAFSIQLSSGEV